jgi:TonB family protein
VRHLLLAGVAGAAVALAATQAVAQPAAQAPIEGRWVTNVHLLYWHLGPADSPARRLEDVEPRLRTIATNWWIRPTDIPEDLRSRPLSAITVIALDIDPAGLATDCRLLRTSGEPRLDRLACTRISARETISPLYSGPGRPIASRWTVAIGWETLPRGGGQSAFASAPPAPPAPPPPPPPPPGAAPIWPQLTWRGHLRPASLPTIQSMFPSRARRREGIVGLELGQTPAGGITTCTVASGSGDTVLDEAACVAARQLDLRYTEPCNFCSDAPMPLEIVWRRRGGSHIRPPLLPPWTSDAVPPMPRDPADTRTAIRFPQRPYEHLNVTPGDLAGIDLARPYRSWIPLRVEPDMQGRVRSCSPDFSSGIAALDARLCNLARQRLRVQPATDVFGDQVRAKVTVYARIIRF